MWCGKVDFRRVEAAIKKHRQWVYMVLTFPATNAVGINEIFRSGLDKWYSLAKRIKREFLTCEYIQTWEITQRGTPHCNVLIHSPSLFSAVDYDRKAFNRQWLLPNIRASGFGRIHYCRLMRDATAMAGYLTKLTRELTGAGPKCQVPVNAPAHFRRLRASRGLLPPRHKDPDLTGRLIREPLADLPPTGRHAHGQLE